MPLSPSPPPHPPPHPPSLSPPRLPPPTPLKPPRTIYTGTFISTPSPTTLEILPRHAIGVDEGGVIRFCGALPLRGGGADEGGADGNGEGGDGNGNCEGADGGADDEEVVRGWVERQWGFGGGGWEWVRGGRGWWFPGFVGEWGGFFLVFGFWF